MSIKSWNYSGLLYTSEKEYPNNIKVLTLQLRVSKDLYVVIDSIGISQFPNMCTYMKFLGISIQYLQYLTFVNINGENLHI